MRPSDSGEFAPELSSPADPSHAGPRGELDTGWGLRFLKFPYFRYGSLEFIIFFTLFELAHRRRRTGGSTRGELDQGESSSRGWFFLKNSVNFVFFAVRPSDSLIFSCSFRARTPDPREVWFHDVPRDELDSGASSSPGRGFRLLVFANSQTFIFL
jgi:hypothetical protein